MISNKMISNKMDRCFSVPVTTRLPPNHLTIIGLEMGFGSAPRTKDSNIFFTSTAA